MSVINSRAALHYSWDNSGTFVFLCTDYVKEGNTGQFVSVFTSSICSAAVRLNGQDCSMKTEFECEKFRRGDYTIKV